MSAKSNSSGGVGFCGLLGLLFIALKLCNVINWSWWWVLLPIYGPIVVSLLVCVIMIGVALIGMGIACAFEFLGKN